MEDKLVMEGKREDGDDASDGVEQYREFIVDGEFYQALDLGRRLLQLEGPRARRNEAALLLLDRLRSNREDSADHANALLRVLANYATPTKELTEEVLALLFFCDHRVQIIHHLSKLTFDTPECVRLVLNAYIELLSSDRSLLVPILGSLADLPLTPGDKAIVIDATEGLLDAATEEDVPAVVQSLLSMLVPAASARIVDKIRSQCNRLCGKAVLSLTFDVITRNAVAGSTALTAFLRVIRNSDVLTPFDIILLALLTTRPSENSVAVRTTAAVAVKSGAINRKVIQETIQSLRDQKWNASFACFVGLSSSLLSACFNTYRSTAVLNTVQCAVDLLGHLVILRTPAQEEALTLLMTLVSQPQRLVLSTRSTFMLSSARVLCWDVARCVADQLAQIAIDHVAALAPYAHIFLDHLYGITSFSGQSFSQGDDDSAEAPYPASILESLCRTMVVLVKRELGLVSLLMITIQKQLVVPVGGPAWGVIGTRRAQASDVGQVKQLMAVFLAGEMLRQGVGETSDRASIFRWIQKLLASNAVSDVTTAHVVRLLASNPIRATLSSSDIEACSTLLSTVFRQHGFEFSEHREFVKQQQKGSSSGVEIVPGLSGQSDAWLGGSFVFDVVKFVQVARLGEPIFGWQSLVNRNPSANTLKIVERSIRAKFATLQADVEGLLSTASDITRAERTLVCSFALPSVTEDTFAIRTLPGTLWCYACALEVAVMTTNSLVLKQQESEANWKGGVRGSSEALRLRRRLLNRVQACWLLHRRLIALLDEARTRLKQEKVDEMDQGSGSIMWLRLQVNIISLHTNNVGSWFSRPFSGELCSLGSRLSLSVVSAIFGGLWKQQTLTVESGLEIELFGSFPAHVKSQPRIGGSRIGDVDPVFATVELLISTQDGKRSVKYISRRMIEYAEQLTSLGEDYEVAGSDDEDINASSERHWILIGTRTLCAAVQSIIEVCQRKRQRGLLNIVSNPEWGEDWEVTVMELLSKGVFQSQFRFGTSEQLDAWFTHCEILFRSISQATVQAKEGDICCQLKQILHTLTSGTRLESQIGRLCLALLHCPFSESSTSGGKVKLVETLPLDIASSDMLKSWIRPQPQKFHHLINFIVGSWVCSSRIAHGIKHLTYILECINELVSATSLRSQSVKQSRFRSQREGAKSSHNKLSTEGDLGEWVAQNGEHRILKNLTNESLPVLLESVIACIASSPLPGPSSSVFGDRQEGNPFMNLMGAIAAMGKSLEVYASAESFGYSFPQRTSTALLRSGPVVVKKLEDAIDACFSWHQGGEGSSVGAIDDLQSLLEASLGFHLSMERTVSSFQERVRLTVQHNVSWTSAREGDTKPNRSRRWGNELLSKAYGDQLQRRKALTKSEVKLLPYFSQSTEHLKALITELSDTYRFDIKEEHARETTSAVLEVFEMSSTDLEGILKLLDANSYALRAELLGNAEMLKERWSVVRDNTYNSLDVKDIEDGSNDDEFDSSSSDEQESYDEFDGVDEGTAVIPELESTVRNKRASGKVHTLTPQKKRTKGAGATNR